MQCVAPAFAARASRSGGDIRHDEPAAAGLAQSLHQRQTDHSGSDHHDRIVQRRRRAAYRVQGNRERLHQRGVLERQASPAADTRMCCGTATNSANAPFCR